MKVWIAAAALVLAATGSAEAGSACKNIYYYGSNAALLTGGNINDAKENAAASWVLRVTASIGPLYADWDKANAKSFSCVRQSGRLKCTAKAIPCRDE